MSKAPLRAVIFDIDGTLVDSNDAHAYSWTEAFVEFGYGIPFDRVRPLIGKGGDKLLPELTGVEADSEKGKQISARREQIFMTKYLPQLQPFPRTRELLQRLRDARLKLVVATSAKQEEMQALLNVTGAAGLFEQAATSSDAKESKPDPDIVQAALQRADVPAEQAIMIGDTPYDIEAAGKSGVPIIAVRCGGWDDAHLKGAVTVYADPAALLAHYDESPLG